MIAPVWRVLHRSGWKEKAYLIIPEVLEGKDGRIGLRMVLRVFGLGSRVWSLFLRRTSRPSPCCKQWALS